MNIKSGAVCGRVNTTPIGVCESVQIICIGESEYSVQHLSVNIIFVGVCGRVNTTPIGV